MANRWSRFPFRWWMAMLIAGVLSPATCLAGNRAGSLQLTLPPEFYAVPGIEMSIYYDNVVLTETPEQYRFEVACDIGKAESRRWTVTPEVSAVGEHRLRLAVYDVAGNELEHAWTTLRVIRPDAGAGRTIRLLIVGDSLTHATIYPNEIARLLSAPGNPRWKMLGTHRPSRAIEAVAHEGYGGWTWKRFATQYEPNPDGTHRKQSSPFVRLGNDGSPGLDLERYFDEQCDGQRPDFVTFLLGINDCFSADPENPAAIEARIDAMLVHAEALLSAFRKAAPKAQLGICLTPPPNVREEAFQANYQGRYRRWGWKRIQHRLVQRLIERFGDREAEQLFLVPTELNLDPVDGFPADNAVHPNAMGYKQIGASIYAWLKARLASGARKSVLAKRLDVPAGARRTLVLKVPNLAGMGEPYLFFKAAARSSKAGGYCNRAVRVLVGGTAVDTERLCNRPATAMMMNGHVLTVAQGDGCLLIPWAPDFTATDKDPLYALTGGIKACEYELYLGGLLNEGENVIAFVNTNSAGLDYTVMLGDIEFRTRPAPPAAGNLAPAPSGDLPVIVPKAAFPRTYSELRQDEATIAFTVNARTFTVQSEFSTPDGQWVTGENPYFRHRREWIERNEWIIVRDTLVNLTREHLPVMQRHRLPVGGEATGVWLAGAMMPTKSGRHSGGANPSAFAATRHGGVGLVALNDEFRVHATMIAERGSITLADPHFVLAPRATYTAEFAIVPVTEPDFYAFVNAARRLLDVNFTLDVCFAFMFHEPPIYDWSDATFTRFIDNKSANFVVKSNYGVRTKDGHPARSTDWIAGPHTIYRDFHKRVRRLYPDHSVRTGIYYHCFLDTHEANKERFAADRALDAKGEHITYGQGRHRYMSLYIPTLEAGRWGEEIAKVLDIILDDIGVDGVFWDEFAWSTTPFVYSHLDGCSADIDPKTHRIRRLKGSVSLLSRDFRARQVKRIQERGAVLIANGAPWTRTLARFKFPAFTETGSISHCRKMLLYSPMALGDHLSERTEKDAYRVMMRALDYGCLYAWYGSNVFPEYKTLTEHMYPITPIEIHPGYVIGRERIITNRSGLFGWGDASDFCAYVYDREGRPTDRYRVKRIERDGKTYAEVRIPGGFSAAIVRCDGATPTANDEARMSKESSMPQPP